MVKSAAARKTKHNTISTAAIELIDTTLKSFYDANIPQPQYTVARFVSNHFDACAFVSTPNRSLSNSEFDTDTTAMLSAMATIFATVIYLINRSSK